MEEQDLTVEFLTYAVKNLVDNQDAVKVTRTVDEMGVLLTLDVHPEDMGKVIGRKGATAKAIRTLLRVVGMKYNARVNMKINEPEGGTGGVRAEAVAFNEEPAAPLQEASDIDAAMEELKADL
ncbi:MAG: putative RNA-binding protein YlqC (UPF0109 family) [Planctomycetota bacterium]|jgi:predicted RNA-binding protein YlqC (UPF0109 family)